MWIVLAAEERISIIAMKRIKERFTKWYIKKGYTFGYALHRIDFDDPFYQEPIAIFDCPWHVKPLLWFFSPSVYFREKHGKAIMSWLEEGINSVTGDCDAR